MRRLCLKSWFANVLKHGCSAVNVIQKHIATVFELSLHLQVEQIPKFALSSASAFYLHLISQTRSPGGWGRMGLPGQAGNRGRSGRCRSDDNGRDNPDWNFARWQSKRRRRQSGGTQVFGSRCYTRPFINHSFWASDHLPPLNSATGSKIFCS